MQQLNVRAIPDPVMKRLGEQAAAEGVSLSEWVRQLLERAAAVASPTELIAQRSRLAGRADQWSADEFDDYYAKRLGRREG